MRPIARLQAAALLAVLIAGCANHPVSVNMDGTVTTYTPTDNRATTVAQRVLPGYLGECCDAKIALIDVDGVLVNRNMSGIGSFGENPVGMFREKLEAAAADPRIRALVLRINSPGGGVTACDIMRRDLETFKSLTGIPVVACLMDVGTGGAYYLATAADVIVAHPTTVTGGIGVILNLYNLEDAMAQQNVLAMTVRAGKFVDIGSPIKAMTPEGRIVLQKIADEFHARFRNTVLATRPIQAGPESEIFDGRIFTAGEAQSLKLVDQLGYLSDAVATARGMGGMTAVTPVVMFRRCHDRALSQYDITPNLPTLSSIFPFSIPGIDRAQMPTFLYMWQPEPTLEKTGGQ